MKLVVNGVPREIEADEDEPLLWVLRDRLGLMGTKFGCGQGACGACTVHVDGEAVRSCLTPVATLVGKAVTTIEGLPEDHVVVQSFAAEDTPQCGYCQPGQVMSAAALLKKSPRADDREIVAFMSGNVCRCGTSVRLLRAVRRARDLGS